MKIDADDFVSMLSSADGDELAQALGSSGLVYTSKEVEEKCIAASERAAEDAVAEQEDLLDELRDLINGGRVEDALLLIERTLHPRRPRPTDVLAVAA